MNMRFLWTTYWLIAISAFISVGITEAADITKQHIPNVAEILSVFAKRAETAKEGEICWTIPKTEQSAFSRFETDWVPSSGSPDQEISGSIRFDDKKALYDSVTFSYADFGMSPARGISEVDFLHAALSEGTTDPNSAFRDLSPYAIVFSDNQRIHYWQGGPNEYPRAVILPAVATLGSSSLSDYTSFNSDSSDNWSGGPSAELHEWLAAPLLLAFRPFLFDPGLSNEEACQIERTPVPYEGRPCYILHVAAPTKDTPSPFAAIERIYWVDPSRDYQVVRCFLIVHGYGKGSRRTIIQLDVDYDHVKNIGWVPAEWTVMRLGWGQWLVQQIATARRTKIDLHPSKEQANTTLTFLPGTWVKDTITNEQYYVDDHLKQRKITEPYPLAYRYTDLVSQFGGKDYQSTSTHPREQRRTMLHLMRWPGILIPLSIITAILLVAHIAVLVYRRHVRRRIANNIPDEYRQAFDSVLDDNEMKEIIESMGKTAEEPDSKKKDTEVCETDTCESEMKDND